VRGKWIDQSQSHNVFMQGVSGKKLSNIYQKAWRCGLKATYYLRTLGATQIEKSTLSGREFGFTQKREYTAINREELQAEDIVLTSSVVNSKSKEEVMCSILNSPECESCQ
jgi:ribonucleoside-diphosphate reductase alpha chain